MVWNHPRNPQGRVVVTVESQPRTSGPQRIILKTLIVDVVDDASKEMPHCRTKAKDRSDGVLCERISPVAKSLRRRWLLLTAMMTPGSSLLWSDGRRMHCVLGPRKRARPACRLSRRQRCTKGTSFHKIPFFKVMKLNHTIKIVICPGSNSTTFVRLAVIV
jgi:hypothetical protein